jgi:hypothetical protein
MSERNTPENNRAQNRQFNEAIRRAERILDRKMTFANRRRIHDEITGQNLSLDELVDFIVSLYSEGEDRAESTEEGE